MKCGEIYGLPGDGVQNFFTRCVGARGRFVPPRQGGVRVTDEAFDAQVNAVVAEYTKRLGDLSDADEAGQQALFDELAARAAGGDHVALAAIARFATAPPWEAKDS